MNQTPNQTPLRLLSPQLFPVRMRLVDEATGEQLWQRVVTLEEATDLARVQVPGFGKDSRTVRTEITDATGHVTTLSSDNITSDSYDPEWPPS